MLVLEFSQCLCAIWFYNKKNPQKAYRWTKRGGTIRKIKKTNGKIALLNAQTLL